jgi:hypothetical protein
MTTSFRERRRAGQIAFVVAATGCTPEEAEAELIDAEWVTHQATRAILSYQLDEDFAALAHSNLR